MFPGQGSQWVGMAVGLLDEEPVFAARLAECEVALGRFVDFSVVDVLRGDGGGLERVEVVQPVLWAVMVSLAELWRSVGVVPGAVVGHSQGEIAAAVVSGVLSLEDGAAVVALRSRAIAEELAGVGGMVSLGVSCEVAEGLIAGCEGLSVAAVNGPGSTVVSGEVGAVEELVVRCEGSGVRVRRVPVDYASHSVQVEGLRERLLGDLGGVCPGVSSVPFYSSVTGGRVDGGGLGAGYWFENLRSTVRFEEVTRALVEDGRTIFLEVSPHPVLTVGLSETVEAVGVPAAVLSTLRRGEGGRERWLTALAEAHVHGVGVDWTAVLPEGRPVDLPTY
ncbi:acyltransferase domain-containing protein, partial [Streptomyces sp. ACA25]|uniref:acyltransferase domain-containing protein n=1 Tax=Streptomyces sp. ACA25 TaxID=3022596 RepID=UPI003FA72F11